MKNNQVIIDEREAGKTTYLFKELNKNYSSGNHIILLDSATDHAQKSLLRMVCNKYNNSQIIDMRNPNEIVINSIGINRFKQEFMNFFPFTLVKESLNKILCFDLSYFLEKGHDVYDETNSIDLYNYYRSLYNYLSEQIIVSLILMEKYGIINNTTVYMDEIEFPVVDYDITKEQKNLCFLASVHQENAFGTFYKSFDKSDFVSYKRK